MASLNSKQRSSTDAAQLLRDVPAVPSYFLDAQSLNNLNLVQARHERYGVLADYISPDRSTSEAVLYSSIDTSTLVEPPIGLSRTVRVRRRELQPGILATSGLYCQGRVRALSALSISIKAQTIHSDPRLKSMSYRAASSKIEQLT
jgi:hypothetical protein